MGKKQKSAFELAMERLDAADRKSGVKKTTLTAKQKEDIAEARRICASRLAEREIRFRDATLKLVEPSERETAESEYQTDRHRINDDCEKAIERIRKG